MKNYYYGLFILFLFIFTECKKDDIIEPIDIQYSFVPDSVSPLILKLKTNKEITAIKWLINDTIKYEGGEKSVNIICYNPGKTKVRVFATGVDMKKYQGEIEIIIPNVATKLIIKGIVFENKMQLNLDRDSVLLSFYHYNNIDNPIYKIKYKTSEFINSDTVKFKAPILLNVLLNNDFNKLKNSDVFVSLESTPSMTEIYKRYYNTNFDMVSEYFDRLYMPENKNGLLNLLSDTKAKLLVNWK